MATVIQGMDYTNLENWLQLVVRGGLLVVAVGLDMATNRRPAWMRRIRERFTKTPSSPLPPVDIHYRPR